MDKYYDWLKEKYYITTVEWHNYKNQHHIGFMMEFLHEKYNCKEIDIIAEKDKSICTTAYEFLKLEIEKRTSQN